MSTTNATGPIRPSQITWDELDKTRFYIIGPTLFLATRAAVYPSNLVKTRLQVQSSSRPLYRGTFDAFRKIYKSEGFQGYYKGFGASTANIIAGNVYMTMYEMARKVAMERAKIPEKTANFVAGAFASLVSQTIVVPLDIVSQHMMISDQGKTVRASAGSLLSITKNIYQREGIRGFYRGYLVSIATYAPNSALWWGGYGALLPITYDLFPSKDADPFWRLVASQGISGGISGIITAVLTNPLDIVRTRAQVYTEYGAIETAKRIFQRDGWKGFMTGTTARVLQMGPSGVLMISTYECVKRLSRKSPISE